MGTGTVAASEPAAARPAEALRRACDTPAWLSVADAQTAVSTLTQALAGCQDPPLKARMHYQAGILCFKGGMTDRALQVFQAVAGEKDYPAVVRLCSLNMLGQIHRLLGADTQSLDAFHAVIGMGEDLLSTQEPAIPRREILRLVCLARIGRAEMYGVQRNHPQSAAEYAGLAEVLQRSRDADLRKRYGPLAYDRLSQSRLCAGETAEYFKAANTLIAEFPRHDRVPLARLEMLCVEILTRLCPDSTFSGGAVDAPARTIALIPKMTSSPSPDEFLDAIARLCEEYTQGYPAMLLRYHYAWALDARGRRKAAVEVMGGIAAMSLQDGGAPSVGQSVAKILRDYAAIQRAILLSDETEHRKAFELLNRNSPTCGLSHLADLHKSIRNAIETLLKEAPRHGTQ